MRARHVWVGVAAALLALGCGAGSSDKPAAKPTARAVSAVQQAYLDALTGIDAGLTGDVDRALRRGRDVCVDIRAGKDEATVVRSAAARYDGGHAQVDEAKARQIVNAVRASRLCD